MKQFLFLLLVILSSSSIVYAGLGETEIQLAERYGQPLYVKLGLLPDSTWRSYRFQGMLIDVQFFDGVSQEEQLHPKLDGKFSVAEVRLFLKTSVLKGEWENLEKLDEPDANGQVVQQYVALRQGKELVAHASVSTFFVAIQSGEYIGRRSKMAPGGNISRAGKRAICTPYFAAR